MNTNLILRSVTSVFEEDVTKNAVLSIADVDNNFIYLKNIALSGGTGGSGGTSTVATIQNKGAVSGTVSFNLGQYSHFTLSANADISATLFNAVAPFYVLIEFNHTASGTTITNLPGIFSNDFAWASNAGNTTILGGIYNGATWSWVSSVYGSSTSPSLDTDAAAFFIAAGITDSTQKSAWNNFVLALKAASLWSKMVALYPFIGGTSTAHKYNAKNPVDSDAAFRLSFSGGVLHNSAGVTAGTGKAILTHLVPNSSLTQNNTHLSIYCKDAAGGVDYMVAVNDGTGSEMSLIHAGGTFYNRHYNDSTGAVSLAAGSQGLLIGTRTSSAILKSFVAGTQVGSTGTGTAGTLPNIQLSIACENRPSGVVNDTMSRSIQFVSIGEGLSDSDVTAFTTAVNALQTSLSRA